MSTLHDARVRPDRTVRGRPAAAAILTLAAGGIHLAAAVPHYGDDPLLGSGFLLTGWVQVVIAALLLRRRPARATAWAGVAVHAAALGILAVSWTVGLPLGHRGAEPLGLPDVTTAACEALALVVLGAWLVRPQRVGVPARMLAGSLGIATLAALGGTTVAVASLGTDGHGHGEANTGGDQHVASAEHGHEDDAGHDDGHDDPTGAVDDAASADPVAGDDRVHVHPDESIHVHAVGEVHEHPDGTAHVHASEASAPASPTPADTATESHTHAPGEGHG